MALVPRANSSFLEWLPCGFPASDHRDVTADQYASASMGAVAIRVCQLGFKIIATPGRDGVIQLSGWRVNRAVERRRRPRQVGKGTEFLDLRGGRARVPGTELETQPMVGASVTQMRKCYDYSIEDDPIHLAQQYAQVNKPTG